MLSFNEILPFLALLIGTIPIIIFVRLNKAICDSCGGQMKISSGYPRIVYRCKKCEAEIDTGIYSESEGNLYEGTFLMGLFFLWIKMESSTLLFPRILPFA
jgi:hypothetical protein